jgi:hypothetical protein
MMSLFNKININTLVIKFVLFFLIFISTCYFYLNLNDFVDAENYAYNELFINYQAGFIRRGLLGEIFWQLNSLFLIKPLIFFSYFFFTLYLAQIYLFIKIFKIYKESYFIYFLIFFSPALILFPIYEENLYFIKDIIIKLSILFHVFILIRIKDKRNKSSYLEYLKFIIIPILTISILIHEYQVLYISVHLLLSLSFIKSKNEIIKIFKLYLLLLIPIFLILIFMGNLTQYENLNLILKKFEIGDLHNQLAGGLYKAIGGFYKWHFYYFSYRDFIQLLSSLFLSIGVFFFMFHFFIKERILKFHNNYQKNYIYFFIPILLSFLLARDHGRNISLLSTHLLAFYGVLILDHKRLDIIKNQIKEKFFVKISLIIFLIFYIFMWRLDQLAGFGIGGRSNIIFKSSIFAEVIKLIKFLYLYIDLNILDLPEIRL